ncbi:5-methyltetrahydropteroyltriglutamate--homocysteine S-methyltransferase [Paenibacillus sp. HW567]|uniref:5-methyltetrahydropteroyltriglutamate-- homocysteine S-methyltransferase n=1 Tax=Paenibacillus sp. HW567 TaxID=1034769 RepID=UPI00036E7FFF|nr:5-methyltetrahydropteroyltriglutamate--homocysteine S-methyltransferase [Paenibacillus sp. HW567]
MGIKEANTALEQAAPFRADHVGSLLRPERLRAARSRYSNGIIDRTQLRQIENEEIRIIVHKQVEAGLRGVTDGEFRRAYWHYDFLEHLGGFEGFSPGKDARYTFKNEKNSVPAYDIRNTGRISFDPAHPFIEDFRFLKSVADEYDGIVAKQTIPSPNQLLHELLHEEIRNKEIYPDFREFAYDIGLAYQQVIQAFYDAGCRYLQLDDVHWASLAAVELWPDGRNALSEFTRDEMIQFAINTVNKALEKKPSDLIVTTHICRGNFKSSWAYSGGYEPVAETLLGKENIDGFFLEYDTERAGDFRPLRHLQRKDARVVLGLFTSKTGELEDRGQILQRIEEASAFVPLEQLAISPQCGFSSTEEGNLLTEEEQWRKLKYIVELSKEVWR